MMAGLSEEPAPPRSPGLSKFLHQPSAFLISASIDSLDLSLQRRDDATMIGPGVGKLALKDHDDAPKNDDGPVGWG